MSNTKTSPGKLNLYPETRAAVLLRGMTLGTLAKKIGIHHNTIRLAMKYGSCPRARAKIMRELKISA